MKELEELDGFRYVIIQQENMFVCSVGIPEHHLLYGKDLDYVFPVDRYALDRGVLMDFIHIPSAILFEQADLIEQGIPLGCYLTAPGGILRTVKKKVYNPVSRKDEFMWFFIFVTEFVEQAELGVKELVDQLHNYTLRNTIIYQRTFKYLD